MGGSYVMRHVRQLALAALTTGLVLCLFASSATALRAIETGGVRVWERVFRAVVFEDPATGVRVTCELKQILTFDNVVIQKRLGVRVGTQSEVIVAGSCRGGVVILPNEGNQRIPIFFNGFAGTLPSITAIFDRISTFEFLITAVEGLVRCSVRGELALTDEGSPIRTSRLGALTGVVVTRLAGAFVCPAREGITVRGEGTLTLPVGGDRIVLI